MLQVQPASQIPETTLTMIVRDELINPAGGLLPLLESHAPYFPEIVMVDTGSVDGTRELLEHLAGTYKNIKVYDVKFKGYGSARQNANSKVRTKYSFCLDADERVSYLQGLAEEVEKFQFSFSPSFFLKFPMHNVTEKGEKPNSFCWNPRFFPRNKVRFERAAFEWPEIDDGMFSYDSATTSSSLLHFLPSE